MKQYKIIFKFGKKLYVAKREGKTGEDALNNIKEQCRIANLAFKRKKSFEMVQIDQVPPLDFPIKGIGSQTATPPIFN